jgi:ubiquinone/menaquinone biosynthesis C-methylase UbiE
MMCHLKRLLRKIFNLTGFDILKMNEIPTSPKDCFLAYHYQRHNQRRLEHLSSLGLEFAGATVLEVGAGIGDHTSFFIDRGSKIVSTDAREENLKILRTRYPGIKTLNLNLDDPDKTFNEVFDIVYCYGLLYHLKNPVEAIEFMSRRCQYMLLLETQVSFGNDDSNKPHGEDPTYPVASYEGWGCQPTRRWVYNQLKRHFEFVYMPITQPNHEEFLIDWTNPPLKQSVIRSVFIASRQEIMNSLLSDEIPMKQTRH